MATKRRKVVKSEGRQMIAKVYHFLREEYDFTMATLEVKCDLSHLRPITQRTADATGVSKKTVERILKEEKQLPSTSSDFISPMKRRKKRDNKMTIDSYTANVIRSSIQNYIAHNEIPTLVKLKSVLHRMVGFDGCLATLRRLLKKMGYTWYKTEKNKRVLTERHDIQLWRLKYLKKMAEYRSQDRVIVYANENYVFTTQVRKKPCSRFILAHAGTRDGVVKDASLVYEANPIEGDHQSYSNYNNYLKWLNEKLLPNLPPGAVIILDSAHSEKLPTSGKLKGKMQQWLTEENIPFDDSQTKVELYDTIKKYESHDITHNSDNFIKSKGFEAMRLPPHHPELNATENILGVIKNNIALNVDQNMTTTETFIYERMENISSETWRNTCNRIEKIEKEYMKYFDLDTELNINLQDDSDESHSEFSKSDIEED